MWHVVPLDFIPSPRFTCPALRPVRIGFRGAL